MPTYTDSRLSLDPRRMLFHIHRDTEWQKVDVKSLLESDDNAMPSPNIITSKPGQSDNNDGLDEMTVKQMMEALEKSNDPEKKWEDQGIVRIMLLANSKKDWNQPVESKFNTLNSIQFTAYTNLTHSDSELSEA